MCFGMRKWERNELSDITLESVLCEVCFWTLEQISSDSFYIYFLSFDADHFFFFFGIIVSFKWYCHLVHCFLWQFEFIFYMLGWGVIVKEVWFKNYMYIFKKTLLYVENMKACYFNINNLLHGILKLVESPIVKTLARRFYVL